MAGALEGLRATAAEMATAGTNVTSATVHPPSQRPATIVRTGAGDSHVKWNVPARISAPSTASPITRQAMGMSSENNATSAMVAKATSAGASSNRDRKPKNTAAAHGTASIHQRRTGRQARSV